VGDTPKAKLAVFLTAAKLAVKNTIRATTSVVISQYFRE